MSVMRCDKHDRHWDSDVGEQCPQCASEPQAEPPADALVERLRWGIEHAARCDSRNKMKCDCGFDKRAEALFEEAAARIAALTAELAKAHEAMDRLITGAREDAARIASITAERDRAREALAQMERLRTKEKS